MDRTRLSKGLIKVLELLAVAQKVCGVPWLVMTGTIAAVNFLIAFRLIFFSRSLVALVAFMPVAFLPFVLGVLGSASGLLQAVAISIGESKTAEPNSALLLSWALLPLTLGGAFSAPAFVAAAMGRLWLATRGIRLSKAPVGSSPNESPTKGQEDAAAYQAYADHVTKKGHRKS